MGIGGYPLIGLRGSPGGVNSSGKVDLLTSKNAFGLKKLVQSKTYYSPSR